LISSWAIPPSELDYNIVYEWRIVGKNGTCSITGPTWSLTTEQSPGVIFIEPFLNMNFWTSVGPLGITNWSIQNTANAGGLSPELRLFWDPEFNGLSKFVSDPIVVENNRNYSISFDHFLDWWANPAPTLGIGVSYDNGVTYNTLWSIQPSGNVGPATVNVNFTTPPSDNSNAVTNLYLVFFHNGNSFNIDNWYIDDVILTDEDFSIVANPTNVSATAAGGSQIDVAFTPNLNNDNVVIVWNLSGVFTVPSGSPPGVGQTFAGGTLLSNGTNSPVNHIGLNPLTTYYYKLFSFDGVN
jgi:hypothetical protein